MAPQKQYFYHLSERMMVKTEERNDYTLQIGYKKSPLESDQVAEQEGLERTSSHGDTKAAAVCGTAVFENDLRTSKTDFQICYMLQVNQTEPHGSRKQKLIV